MGVIGIAGRVELLVGRVGLLGLLGAMGLIGLMGCTHEGEEMRQQREQRAVGFGSYTEQYTTRGNAAQVYSQPAPTRGGEVYAIPDGGSLGVYAYYHDESGWLTAPATNTPNFMWNQQVTYQADNNLYYYTPLKYWPNEENDKVSFIAYYPYTTEVPGHTESPAYPNNATGLRTLLDNDDAALPSFDFTVKDGVDNQIDFLVSDLLTDLPYSRDTENDPGTIFEDLSIYDVVKFPMHHALAKIEFHIVADRDIYKDVARFKLNSLNITNIYKDGTLTTDYAAATGTTLTWSGQSTKHGTDETDPQYKIDFKTITPQLLMPQTLGDDAMINLDYEITFKSDGTSYHYSGTTPVPDQEYTYRNAASLQLNTMKEIGTGAPLLVWEANHHYIYTIRLRANRIEFTGQVVEWGETTTINNIEVIE